MELDALQSHLDLSVLPEDTPRHLESMLESAGVNVRLARRRLGTLARASSAAVEATKARFVEEHWWDPVLDKVVATFEERSEWLRSVAS